jgi:hypothetical protein
MQVKEGRIYTYYIFDLASEIQLEKLEKVLGKKPLESQISYTRLTPKYVRYPQPPYLINITEKAIELEQNIKPKFKITAKIYDFGVVSIRFSLQFSGTLEEMNYYSDLLVDNEIIEKEAIKQLEKIKKEISEALIKPVEKITYEDYIIFYVKEFDKKVKANELIKQYERQIANIIRAEKEDLNENQIKDTLKSSISYFDDDIAFIDWNAAFIYDPRDAVDTLEVLEYANIELLELRTYDEMLDREIDSAYSRIGPEKLSFLSVALDPFSKTLNRLEEVKLDVTQVIEKVENALKLVGDPYLAKVYSAASESFRLKEWKNSVEEKLDIIEGFYETVVSRIQTTRSVILEMMIVLLFIFEIIMALLFTH